jgi:CII-binding regulator of phage lambda lysogenization HflD
MIDPVSIGLALTGIQKAVSLVKQVSKTAQDVQSLGPALGNLFSAEQNCEKAVVEAKSSGNASNMQIAMQIELELDKVREIKKHYQLEFMKVGKIDVWNSILERAKKMDKADKFAQQAAEDRAKAKKEEMDEVLTILAVCLLVVALSVFGYFVYSEVQDAKAAARPVHHHKS